MTDGRDHGAITPKIRGKLRLEAVKLLVRLEKIPEPDKHLLAGPGSITIAQLIQSLREFRTVGQTFVHGYTRSSGKFRGIIDSRLAEIEAHLSSPEERDVRKGRVS